MNDDLGLLSVRQSVLGADEAVRRRAGGPKGPARPTDEDGQPWPILPLGRRDGVLHFLDVAGEKRELTARQLQTRPELMLLFGGDDTWLRKRFPKMEEEKTGPKGAQTSVWHTVDFKINDASAALQRACFAAGIWGAHMKLRHPGIWRDLRGRPVVHCGDEVWIGGKWCEAGEREGNQVWAADAPTPRPGIPCGAAIGKHLHNELVRWWNWRDGGGPAAIVGMICNSYYGAALNWRPGGFVSGETGSGKSGVTDVVVAALPLNYYDNDTTKSGIEQAVGGRAMPIIIDEAADRANPGAARQLADLVLSASSGAGTQGSRGTVDGKGRKIEVVGLIMMFSINPPDLEPQHLGRLTQIELQKPLAGEDHRAQHAALAEFARDHAPDLWARALASWERYVATLALFREGLRKLNCAPREMDQAGALLAGYWVLTHEGLPDERGVRAAISTLHGHGDLAEPGLIRSITEVEADSRPHRMLRHLMSSMVYLHRSSEREPVGTLIEIGMGAMDMLRHPEDARDLLSRYGIRIVLACEGSAARRQGEQCTCRHCLDRRGPTPRKSDSAGAWFARQNPELKKLFDGTPFEGDRWQHEMLRLPTAARSTGPVRIGSVPPTRAIWLGRSELLPPNEEERGLL